jgi:putative oxidoreductase
VLVACIEFGGGILLLAGLLTRWAASLLALEMAVAAYAVHLPNGFFLNWRVAPGVGHGVEMNLVLIGGLASLLFTGPGALSIDGWRRAFEEQAALGRARLRWKVGHH